MKEPGKKYNDEDNMLVNDLRSIVSKARSKAFAAVTTYCGRRTERSITCRIRKACDRDCFGCSYRGIREGILIKLSCLTIRG